MRRIFDHTSSTPQRRCPARIGAVAGGAAVAGVALAAFMPGGTALPARQADTITRATLTALDDSSPGTTTANVAVGTVILLSGLTGSFTLSSVPGDSPVDLGAVIMHVLSNNATGYTVTVRAEAASLVGTGSNTDTIPASDLSVRESTTGVYEALSTATPVTVYAQSTLSAEAPGDLLSNDYEFNTPIPNVHNDTYSVTLDYVASTNP